MIRNKIDDVKKDDVNIEAVEISAEEFQEMIVGQTSTNFTYGYEDTFLMDDIKNRKLYINYPITPLVNESITYHIIRYNEIDKGITDISKRKPIRIFINTIGGSIDDGTSCISAILLSKTPIYTISFGYCYSMGLPMFIAGDRRFITPETTFLNHSGSTTLSGDFDKICDNIEFTKAQNDVLDGIIMSRTKITKKMLDKYRRNDKFFFADEAYKLGIATDILGKTCDLDEIL